MLKSLIKRNTVQSKLQRGFTIIEVMIVLAIAGLILVVVLIAIPQLQRNQRNEQRRSVAARVVSEVNNYAANNRGSIPENQNELNDVSSRYLGCDSTEPNSDCSVNIEDPTTGQPVDLTFNTTHANGAVPDLDDTSGGGGKNGGGTGDLAILNYKLGSVCEGEQLVAGNGRNFALYTVLEGKAVFCLDNR